ncbi:MAG: hypothetical protein ACI4MQ_01925 [Candidatus Coproplasma sp.]
MFNCLTETFLFEYFLADAMLGEFYDRERLFTILGEIFCLPQGQTDGLFRLTESEAVGEIKTEEGYKRYKRIKQYNRLVGNEQGYTEDEEQLIAIKGNAIMTAAKYGITAGRESTQTQVVKTLMGGAENGNTLALRITGILKCEGILVAREREGGVNQLIKAMQWGDVTAALAMFAYSDRDKTELLKILNASVRNTPYVFLPQIIAERYGVSAEGCDEEVALIRRAINANKLNKDTYDPMYARIIFSDAIGIKDKKEILFSENREAISETCDLPLRLKYADMAVDERAIAGMFLNRQKEIDGVLCGLYGSDLRSLDSFRPICLCSDSDYVLDRYVEAIERALPSTHIERIAVGELRDFDFEPTKNNVFVRCLNEKKNNAYILVLKGEISEREIELTRALLKSENRRKFRLYQPTVTLDLSSVLPICVCDRENAKKLKNLVEIVELAPLKAAEKPEAIYEVVERKRTDYNIEEVTVAGDVTERLCSLPVETAEKILDKVIRENRRVSAKLHLNMDIVRPYLDKNTGGSNSYGFGGVNDESK